VITQAGMTLSSDAATGNQWYLDGNPIPGATGQTYTATGNGNYTVVVTIAGCSSATSNTIAIIDTQVAQQNTDAGLTIFPNPNDGNFTLSFNVADAGDYRIRITNALGQLVYDEDLTGHKGEYRKQVDLSQFGKGVYTMSLTNTKNEVVRKILVF
jgi:hypothetical protein